MLHKNIIKYKKAQWVLQTMRLRKTIGPEQVNTCVGMCLYFAEPSLCPHKGDFLCLFY